MVLHSYFFRTIGPAVYGAGGGGVAETNWAQEMATFLSDSETSAASWDFKQQSFWIDNQTTPANSGTGKRTKGGPWTKDSTDFDGSLLDAIEGLRTEYWMSGNGAGVVFFGENGYFQAPPRNGMNTAAPFGVANMTNTTDSELSPDGNNARLITNISTTGYFSASPVIVYYRAGRKAAGRGKIWLKAGNASIVQLVFTPLNTNFAAGSNTRYINVDLSDGSVGNVGSDITNYSVTHVSNGYYKISMECNWLTGDTSDIRYIYFRTIPSKTSAYNTASSGTGETVYYWRHQFDHNYCVDEYIYPTVGDTGSTRCAPMFISDYDGNGLGLFGSVDLTGGDLRLLTTEENWYDWATIYTETNCTLTSGQAMSIWPHADVGGLLTASSAGGTGVVSVVGSTMQDTDFADGNNVLCFSYFKAGTSSKGYVFIEDTTSNIYDGDQFGYYFDLSTGQLYDPVAYSNNPDKSWHSNTETKQPGYVHTAVLSKIDPDWWMLQLSIFNATGSSANLQATFGLCDALGSTTKTLNGDTIYFYPPTYIMSNASGEDGPECNSVAMFVSEQNSGWDFATYIDLTARADTFNPSAFTMLYGGWAGWSGSSTTRVIGSNNTFFSLIGTVSGTWQMYAGASTGTVSATFSDTSADAGGTFKGVGRYTKLGWAATTNDIELINQYGYQIGTDTSFTPPGSGPTYFYFNGLVSDLTALNRRATSNDLVSLTTQKTLSAENTIYSYGANLLALCADDNAAGIEVSNLRVMVLRSTGGT